EERYLIKHERVQKHLLQPAMALSSLFRKPIVIALDEIQSITNTLENQSSLLPIIHRVHRLLQRTSIWMFVSSTESPLGELAPPQSIDPSSRISSGKLKRIRPFYTFYLDIGAE